MKYWLASFGFFIALLTCLGLGRLAGQQSKALSQAKGKWDQIRSARVDLSNGFLHLTNCSCVEGPFSREVGLALLKQSLACLERVAANQDDFPERSQELLRLLREHDHSHSHQAELRTLFHYFDRKAESLDTANRRELWALTQRLKLEFELALIFSALLLLSLCTALFWVGHQESRSNVALRLAEHKYRNIFENAGEGIYQVTTTGRLISANPALAKILGYESPQQLCAQLTDFWGIIVPFEARRNFLAALQLESSLHHLEFTTLRLDGREVWLATSARAVKDDSGRLLFLEGTLQDITDYRQSLERIVQLNRIYAVLSHFHQSVPQARERNSLLKRACQIAVQNGGYRLGVVYLRNSETEAFVASEWAGDQVDPSQEMLEAPFLLAQTHHQTGWLCNDLEVSFSDSAWLRHALSYQCYSVAAFHLHREGRHLGLLLLYSGKALAFDREEMTLLEELARAVSLAWTAQHRDQLRLKAEGDLKVSQEMLWQAQKMEGIGQLAGGVAHDFNNILAVLMMQTELLLMEPLSSEIQEGLEDIRKATERAANLTRQLLLFSRRQVMRRERLDLNVAVTALTKMLQRIIGEDISLQLKLHPQPLVLSVDAGMLDQILLNLTVNARDAMPEGGSLSISTGEEWVDAARSLQNEEAKPGRYLRLEVVDTGPGISPEALPRIFEPFFTTKEVGKGTGLGLSTVFGIVRQHQGLIEVQSSPGQGARFSVFLPALESGEVTVQAIPRQDAMLPGHEGILLVEDDPGLRTLGASLLRKAGYQVWEASDGPQALDIFEQHLQDIQLLFTDVVMPKGINGPELASLMRKRNPNLRIIFTSGYNQDMAGRQIDITSSQGFLAKPFGPRQLLELIRQFLGPGSS